MMMTLFLLAMGLLASQTMAHPGHLRGVPLTSMSRAMHNVERSCSVDVETLCESTPLVRPADPILEWFLSPEVHPPMFASQDLNSLVNDMMDSALRLSHEQPGFVLILEQEPPRPPMLPKETSEEVFDSMVYMLGEELSASQDEKEEPEEEKPPVLSSFASDPIEFSRSLVKFGADLLKKETNEDRRRLARRLTEVSPDMFAPPRPQYRLPFGCSKNRCLMRAVEQGAASPACARSIQQLDKIAHNDVARQMEFKEETFFGLALLYGVLCILTLCLLHHRFRKHGNKMMGNRRLKRRIMQSIYSNPTIKAAIEADLQEDLGHVPPLPPHVLATMHPKGNKNWQKQWRLRKGLKVTALCGVLTLAVVNPFLAMPVLCIFAFARLLSMACCPPKTPEEACSCCCCGGSTDDVANGTISTKQSCCCCCMGSGVCAPSCADCCDGPVPSKKKIDKCCTGTQTCGEKQPICVETGVSVPPPPVCCAPPIMCSTIPPPIMCSTIPPPAPTVKKVRGESTCCCCGLSEKNAKAGIFANEKQARCYCCEGRGYCTPEIGDDCCDCTPVPGLKMPPDFSGPMCCCCKATPVNAKRGKLTFRQEDCKCCRGTGYCIYDHDSDEPSCCDCDALPGLLCGACGEKLYGDYCVNPTCVMSRVQREKTASLAKTAVPNLISQNAMRVLLLGPPPLSYTKNFDDEDSDDSDDDHCCCCCGQTAENADRGIMTAEQAACKCCHGSGYCALDPESDSNEPHCCDCSALPPLKCGECFATVYGNHCLTPSCVQVRLAREKKAASAIPSAKMPKMPLPDLISEEEAMRGVFAWGPPPLDDVDDYGVCCCCGLTEANADLEIMTAEQAACKCCHGSGYCTLEAGSRCGSCDCDALPPLRCGACDSLVYGNHCKTPACVQRRLEGKNKEIAGMENLLKSTKPVPPMSEVRSEKKPAEHDFNDYCCCCGLTQENGNRDIVTAEQAACQCCHGSGYCTLDLDFNSCGNCDCDALPPLICYGCSTPNYGKHCKTPACVQRRLEREQQTPARRVQRPLGGITTHYTKKRELSEREMFSLRSFGGFVFSGKLAEKQESNGAKKCCGGALHHDSSAREGKKEGKDEDKVFIQIV